MVTDSTDVDLEPANAAAAPLLANLLELYIHDLSAVFPDVRLGPDGRFGYPPLALYWSEPGTRFPFLIRCGGEAAGFALARRGSPAPTDPTAMDVAEYFVLRRYRRTVVARRAAVALWGQFPGRWTVRVSRRNVPALTFWSAVVADRFGAAVTRSTYTDGAAEWSVFTLDSWSPSSAPTMVRG